jgi:hypothetical protein
MFKVNHLSGFGAAGPSGPLWTPLELDNLVVYVEADQLALSDTDPVSSFTDLSGNDFHPTASGTERPLYQTNELNGHPVVQYDGVDDFSFNAGPGTSATQYTIACVYKDLIATTASEWTPLFAMSPGGNDLFRREAADTFIFLIGGVGNTTQFAMPQSKGAVLVQLDYPGDNVKVWVNGAKVFDGVLSAPLPASTTLNSLIIGKDATASFGEVKIAAAFGTDDVLTTQEITSFFSAYRTKYALY